MTPRLLGVKRSFEIFSMPLKIKQTVLRLPEEFHAEVKQAAARRRTSLQDAILQALEQWMETGNTPEHSKAAGTAAPVLDELVVRLHDLGIGQNLIRQQLTGIERKLGLASVDSPSATPTGHASQLEHDQTSGVPVPAHIPKLLKKHSGGPKRSGAAQGNRPGKQGKTAGADSGGCRE